MEPNAAWISKEASSPWELVHSPSRRPAARQKDGHLRDGGSGNDGAAGIAFSMRSGSQKKEISWQKGSGGRLEEANTRMSPYPLRSRLSGLPRTLPGDGMGVSVTSPNVQAAKSTGGKNNDNSLNGSAPLEPKLYNIARAEPSPARHEVHALYTGVLASSLRLRDLLGEEEEDGEEEEQIPERQEQQQQRRRRRPGEFVTAYKEARARDRALSQQPAANAGKQSSSRPFHTKAIRMASVRCRGRGNGNTVRSQLVMLARTLVGTADTENGIGVGIHATAAADTQRPDGNDDDGDGAAVAAAAAAGVQDDDVSMAELNACLETGAAKLELELPVDVVQTAVVAAAAVAPAPAASPNVLARVERTPGSVLRGRAARATASPAAPLPGASPICGTPGGGISGQQRPLLRCNSPSDLCHAIQSAQTRANLLAATATASDGNEKRSGSHAAWGCSQRAAADGRLMGGSLASSWTPTHGSRSAAPIIAAGTTSGSAQGVRLELPEPRPVKPHPNLKLPSLAALPGHHPGVTDKIGSGARASGAEANAAGLSAVVAARKGPVTRARSMSRLNPAHPSNSQSSRRAYAIRGQLGHGLAVSAGPCGGGGDGSDAGGRGKDEDVAEDAEGKVEEKENGDEEETFLHRGFPQRRKSLLGAEALARAQGQDQARGQSGNEESSAAEVEEEEGCGGGGGVAAAAAVPVAINKQSAKQQSFHESDISPTPSSPDTEPWVTIAQLAARVEAACTNSRQPEPHGRDSQQKALGASVNGGGEAAVTIQLSAGDDEVSGATSSEGDEQQPLQPSGPVVTRPNVGSRSGDGSESATEVAAATATAIAIERQARRKGGRRSGRARCRQQRAAAADTLRQRTNGTEGLRGDSRALEEGAEAEAEAATGNGAAPPGAETPGKLRAVFHDETCGDELSPDVPIGRLAAAEIAKAGVTAAAVQPEAPKPLAVPAWDAAAVTPEAAKRRTAASTLANSAACLVSELVIVDLTAEVSSPDSADLPIGLLAATTAAVSVAGVAVTKSPGSSPNHSGKLPAAPGNGDNLPLLLQAAQGADDLLAAKLAFPAPQMQGPACGAGTRTGRSDATSLSACRTQSKGCAAPSSADAGSGTGALQGAGVSCRAKGAEESGRAVADGGKRRRKRKRRSSCSSGAPQSVGIAVAVASAVVAADMECDLGGSGGLRGVKFQPEDSIQQRDSSTAAPSPCAPLPNDAVPGSDACMEKEESLLVVRPVPGPQLASATSLAAVRAVAPPPPLASTAGRIQLGQLWKRQRSGGMLPLVVTNGGSSRLGAGMRRMRHQAAAAAVKPVEPSPQLQPQLLQQHSAEERSEGCSLQAEQSTGQQRVSETAFPGTVHDSGPHLQDEDKGEEDNEAVAEDRELAKATDAELSQPQLQTLEALKAEKDEAVGTEGGAKACFFSSPLPGPAGAECGSDVGSDREEASQQQPIAAVNRLHIRSVWKRPRLMEPSRPAVASGGGGPMGRRALLGPRVGQAAASPVSTNAPLLSAVPPQGSADSVPLPTASAVDEVDLDAGDGSAASSTAVDGECEIRLRQQPLQHRQRPGFAAGCDGDTTGKKGGCSKGVDSVVGQRGGELQLDGKTEAFGSKEVSCAGAPALAERAVVVELGPRLGLGDTIPMFNDVVAQDSQKGPPTGGAATAALTPACTVSTAPKHAVMTVVDGATDHVDVLQGTPPRLARPTGALALTAAVLARSPRASGGAGGTLQGKPPRSPGDLRAAMVPLSPCLLPSPSPSSRGGGCGGTATAAHHRLRDPSLHPASVAGGASLSPVQPLIMKLQAATALSSPSQGSGGGIDGPWTRPLPLVMSPMSGSAAVVVRMSTDGPAAVSPVAAAAASRVRSQLGLLTGAAEMCASFLQPLAPIRTKAAQHSSVAAGVGIPEGVKPSVVQAVEALLSIPLLAEDSSPSSSDGGGTADGATADTAAMSSAPVPVVSALAAAAVKDANAAAVLASCASRLDRLLDAAAETHGSSGRPAGELLPSSPLALILDVAAAQGTSKVNASGQHRTIPPVESAAAPSEADPGSDSPSGALKPARRGPRGVQPSFSALGTCDAAPSSVRSPSRTAAPSPAGRPAASSGGPVCLLVCDERLDMLSGKAASPLPPRPRPAGKAPTDGRVATGGTKLASRLSPIKSSLSGQAESPVASVRPPEGYSTPPFAASKHRPLLHGTSCWPRGGLSYPGHQYDSMIEDVVQQMLNEGSPGSPSPLELSKPVAGSAAAAGPAAAGVSPREGVTGVIAHPAPTPPAPSDENEPLAVNGVAPTVAVATAAAAVGLHSPAQQQQQMQPLRRSIYLPLPNGKRRRPGDLEELDTDPAAAAVIESTLAGEDAGTAAAITGCNSQQPPGAPATQTHRRRPRKAPRVDGGTTSAAAVAAASVAAAAAAAANTKMKLEELSNLGFEGSESDDDVLDSFTAGGSGGGSSAAQVKTHGSVRIGPGRGPGSAFASRVMPYGPSGAGNWTKPGLAWSRTPGTAPPGYPAGPSRGMSPQLRTGTTVGASIGTAAAGTGSSRLSHAVSNHHHHHNHHYQQQQQSVGRLVGAIPGPSADMSSQGDRMLDVPRILNVPKGAGPPRRQSTYLSSAAEATNARPTLEQEYREAFINSRLAQAWAAGERWARCDLGGLPADLSKRGVTERLALLDCAASKLNCYRGAEGAAKIIAKVEEEWEHLKRIRMMAASRSTVRTPTGATPSPAPREHFRAPGRPPHTPLPFAAHAHAAAAGAAAAAAAAATAGSALLRRLAADMEEHRGGVEGPDPPGDAAAATPPPPPAAATKGLGRRPEVPQQQQQQQETEPHHGLAELVSAHTHAYCHRGSPPPPPPPPPSLAAAAAAPQPIPHTGVSHSNFQHQNQHHLINQQRHNHHPHVPSHNSCSYRAAAATTAVASAKRTATATAVQQQPAAPPHLGGSRDDSHEAAAVQLSYGVGNTDGDGGDGFGTPVPQPRLIHALFKEGSSMAEGEKPVAAAAATPPPPSKSRINNAGSGDGSALALRNPQQLQLTPPASILKTVPTPYTSLTAAAPTPGSGGAGAASARKAVKFAAVLELGPQSGYRHAAERPVPPLKPAFDLSQSLPQSHQPRPDSSLEQQLEQFTPAG